MRGSPAPAQMAGPSRRVCQSADSKWLVWDISNTQCCKQPAPDLRGVSMMNVADPVHGLPSSWGTKIRTGGLAVILMRAGLKIDKQAFKRAGRVVLRLAFLPMLLEACVDTGLYYW